MLLVICVELISHFIGQCLFLWSFLNCIFIISLIIVNLFSINVSKIILVNVCRPMIFVYLWVIFFLLKRIIFIFIFSISQSGWRKIDIAVLISLIWNIFCITTVLFVVLVVLSSYDIFINIIVCKDSWCVGCVITLWIINRVGLRFIRIAVLILRIRWVAILISTFIIPIIISSTLLKVHTWRLVFVSCVAWRFVYTLIILPVKFVHQLKFSQLFINKIEIIFIL